VEAAADDEALRVPSPAFTTRPPVVRNRALVRAAVLDAMAFAWDSRAYPARDVTLRRVRDAYVLGEGLVFDRNLAVVPASVTQHSPAEVEAAAARLQAVATGGIPTLPGTTLLCAKRGAANYGHWMYEMLPVAWLGRAQLRAGEWRALVPWAEGRLASAIRDSLDLLGVLPGQVATASPAPQRVEEVLIVEGLTAHGRYISPLVADCLADLAGGIAPGDAGRLWVSRAGGSRSFWNEPELCAVLAGAGWTVCRPGELPLREQIGLFKGARHIAGVAGAGLANLAFAAPGARVTSFMPAAMPETFFWLLSELCGHDYQEIRSPQAEKQVGPSAWDGSLVLGLPDVLAYLA
jgi:capsular polysaccharide biosynthesis protein